LQDGLGGLSRERIGAEMRKLLTAPDPAPALAAMQVAGILQSVLPGAEAAAMALLVHLESGTDIARNALRRLALLGGEEVPERLRLSRAEARRLDVLRRGLAVDMPAAELGYRHGPDAGADILLLRAALTGTAPDQKAWQDLRTGAEAVFPVKPADLLPALSGPALGDRLCALEARWIASGFTLRREDLL
jgi:poly(A) polymerase